MKGQTPLRRRRSRRGSRGFSLLELMVVVMLIAIIAAIAAPSMATARQDRVVFDYARQTSELFHNARARSAGRGAAHLVIYTTDASYGTGGRGAVYVFEALDGTASPGPNPSSTCRLGTQWDQVAGYAPGGAREQSRMRLIDFLDVNKTGAGATEVLADIRMVAHTTNTADAPAAGPHVPGTAIPSIALCTTPNGSTFVGTGNTPSEAITQMVSAPRSFTGAFEIDVMRRRSGAPVGLIRRVILSGAAAPRIKSE